MKSDPLVANGNVRLKACRYGLMLYLASDQVIGRSLDCYGEFSEGETELFRQIVPPGACVVEVGANVGAHTVWFGKAVGPAGRVIAFEPQRVIYHLLCANIALNDLSNIYTHQAAAGRAAGTIFLPRLNYAQPNNYGGLGLGNWPEGDPVPMVTLDSLNLPACDLLKVDVEGMESEVIAGAEQTIQRWRPLLYLENDRRDKSADLIRQVFALDYRLYWHTPPLFNPENYFGSGENVFKDWCSMNMLGIPAEQSQVASNFREIVSPQGDWRINQQPVA